MTFNNSFSQIRRSYSEITKENGMNFKTVYNDSGFKSITYISEGRGKMFEFVETNSGFICFSYLYIEPIDKANDIIKLYNDNFVKTNDLEWKDYENNIIYEVSFTKERDVVKLKATIDRNKPKKVFSLSGAILGAKSIKEIAASVIINFEKDKYGERNYSRDNLSYFDIYRINDDLDDIAAWLNYTTLNNDLNKVYLYVPNKLTKMIIDELISKLTKVSSEGRWINYTRNNLKFKITQSTDVWIINVTE